MSVAADDALGFRDRLNGAAGVSSPKADQPKLSLGLMAAVGTAGCAHAASIAWPLHWLFAFGQPLWWLQPLSLLALVWALGRVGPPRHAAWLGWFFATTMQCATWWWLFISLHTYGGLASPLAVLAIVGLAAFLALYYAAVTACFKALSPIGPKHSAIVFASLWLLAELARVAFFTGFPWGEGGYAQLDGPFANLAKLVGVHGLTLGSALLAATIAGLFQQPDRRRAGLLAASLLLALAASVAMRAAPGEPSVFTQTLAPTSAQSAPFTVTLLQGNISQDEKFLGGSGIPNALAWYGEQLRSARSSLVVSPETAIPLLPPQLPEGYLDALLERLANPPADATQTAALIGIPLGNRQDGYTNSVIGVTPALPGAAKQRTDGIEGINGINGFNKGGIYRYDKHHLVPFGEFVHPLFKWFLAIVNMPLSDFKSGPVSQPSFDWQGQRLAPNICYEDLFGEELAARFTDPTSAPTVFVNISNIAWFGNSIAIDQHLAISRMRAIEFERPMIRATNTGATVIIDHTGQVVHALKRHTRGTLSATVEGRSGITPYAWWAARLGLWPWWALCLAVVGLAAFKRRLA